MQKCDLSVIIPAHNTAHYLRQTLNILVCQNLKNCEIIIINDNSVDDTENVIFEFKKRYNNIKYLKSDKKQGAGLSRNIGLDHVNGEFVTFLDSDDWPDLIAYKTAVDVLKKNIDCDFVIWGIKNEYNNKISSYIRTDYNTYTTLNKDVALSLLCNTYSLDITISSYLGNKMFRRSFLNKNKITFKDFLFEDVPFSIEAILYSQKIILLPNIYTHYYQRTSSIVHSFTEKHISDMFKVFSYIQKLINEKYPYYKKDFSALVEKCSKTLFRILFDNVESPIELQQLLCFYFERLFEFCDIKDIIEYLDIERYKNILLNF